MLGIVVKIVLQAHDDRAARVEDQDLFAVRGGGIQFFKGRGILHRLLRRLGRLRRIDGTAAVQLPDAEGLAADIGDSPILHLVSAPVLAIVNAHIARHTGQVLGGRQTIFRNGPYGGSIPNPDAIVFLVAANVQSSVGSGDHKAPIILDDLPAKVFRGTICCQYISFHCRRNSQGLVRRSRGKKPCVAVLAHRDRDCIAGRDVGQRSLGPRGGSSILCKGCGRHEREHHGDQQDN